MAGGPDLVVDLGLLEKTGGSLGMLIHEFHDAGDIVGDYDDAVGDNDLRGELHHFVDSWKVHREKLLGKMNDVYKLVTTSHKAYADADDKLAKDIQGSTQETHQTVVKGAS